MPGRDASCGRRPTGGEAFTTPAIARGVAFVATNEPSLTAFDLKSGSQLWSRDIGGESSPAAGDGIVFLGGDDQSVRALDAATGETRWSSPLGYAIRSSVTFADEAVYIGSGPTLTAIDRDDGSTLWTHVTGGVVTADLAVVAETVIASSHDGYVYALGPPEQDPTETDGSHRFVRGGFTCGWQVVQCAGRSERPASSGRGAACLVDLGLGVRVAEGKVTMSRISYKRLGAALLSLAVPFMMAGPVAAQPAAPEVSSVELACLALGFDVNTCTFAVREGVYEVVEGSVNADLAEQGLAFAVDLGDEVASRDEFGADINEIAINPLPPVASTGEVMLPPSAVLP